jgi:hypothetical protein
MTITGVNLAVAAGIGRFKAAEAGELFWAEPAGAEDRPQSRARHAGRGGLGSGQGASRAQ